MTKLNFKNPLSEDEQWLAFRYVAGELSDAETEAFELQMLDDQRLCDAIVDATLLTTAIAAERTAVGVKVLPVAATVSPSTGGRRAVVAIVTTCCCMAVVVLASQYAGLPQNTNAFAAVVRSEAEILVDAWAEGFDEDTLVEPLPADIGEADLEIPGWLMAAVSLDGADATTDGASSIDSGEEAEWF